MSKQALELALEWLQDAVNTLVVPVANENSDLGITAEGLGQCSVAVISVLKEAIKQQSELEEAIAAGDGTLHGAIDFWKGRALIAEAIYRPQDSGMSEAEAYGIWFHDQYGRYPDVMADVDFLAWKAACAWQREQQGEPVAWIKPEWLNGSYRGALSPVTTYPQVDYVPLYTSAPTIPEGWKLVQVETTVEMQAMWKRSITFLDDLDATWSALLAASPEYKGEKA